MTITILLIIFTIIALAPFAWSIHRLYKEEDYTEIVLHTAFFICISLHAYLFCRDYYYFDLSSCTEKIVQSIAAISIIPLLYVLVCRRMGALFTRDISTLILFGFIGFIVRGNINFGFDTCHMDSCALAPFQIGIYYNDTVLLVINSFHIAMLMQTFFCIYKTFVLFLKMKKEQYHFSKKFKWMQAYIIITLALILLSFVPNEEFTKQTLGIVVYLLTGAMVVNVGYVLTALNYVSSPIEDENNEPVYIITPKRFTRLANKFSRLVETNRIYTTENLHMEDVAKMLGTNRTYVSMMMKEEFGTSFSTYMNQCRVEEAKRILLDEDNDDKLQDVAWQSGFNSLSSFNKVFKSVTGLSPSEWVAETKTNRKNTSSEE